jgi:hypothetical protein
MKLIFSKISDGKDVEYTYVELKEKLLNGEFEMSIGFDCFESNDQGLFVSISKKYNDSAFNSLACFVEGNIKSYEVLREFAGLNNVTIGVSHHNYKFVSDYHKRLFDNISL